MPSNVRDKTVKKNWENLSFHSFHAPFLSRFNETLLSLLRIGRWTFFDQWRVMPKEYRQIPMFGSKFFAACFLVFQVILTVQTSMSQSNHLAKCRISESNGPMKALNEFVARKTKHSQNTSMSRRSGVLHGHVTDWGYHLAQFIPGL